MPRHFVCRCPADGAGDVIYPTFILLRNHGPPGGYENTDRLAVPSLFAAVAVDRAGSLQHSTASLSIITHRQRQLLLF